MAAEVKTGSGPSDRGSAPLVDKRKDGSYPTAGTAAVNGSGTTPKQAPATPYGKQS